MSGPGPSAAWEAAKTVSPSGAFVSHQPLEEGDKPIGGRAELTAAAERVAVLAGERRYTLVSALASGDRVAAEYVWEGTYREGGANVKIRLATFYQLRDGQFVELHEYPCVEAPPAT